MAMPCLLFQDGTAAVWKHHNFPWLRSWWSWRSWIHGEAPKYRRPKIAAIRYSCCMCVVHIYICIIIYEYVCILCYLDQKTDYLYCFRILGQTRVFSSTAFWATLSKSPGSASLDCSEPNNYRPRKGPKFWRKPNWKPTRHIWWIKKTELCAFCSRLWSSAHQLVWFNQIHIHESTKLRKSPPTSWSQGWATNCHWAFFVCGAPNHFNHHLPILLSLVVFPVNWDKTLSWLSNTSFWARNHHFLFTSLFLIVWMVSSLFYSLK